MPELVRSHSKLWSAHQGQALATVPAHILGDTCRLFQMFLLKPLTPTQLKWDYGGTPRPSKGIFVSRPSSHLHHSPFLYAAWRRVPGSQGSQKQLEVTNLARPEEMHNFNLEQGDSRPVTLRSIPSERVQFGQSLVKTSPSFSSYISIPVTNPRPSPNTPQPPPWAYHRAASLLLPSCRALDKGRPWLQRPFRGPKPRQ